MVSSSGDSGSSLWNESSPFCWGFITPPLLPDIDTLLESAAGAPTVRTIARGSESIRFYTLPYTLGGTRLVIGTAQSLRAQREDA